MTINKKNELAMLALTKSSSHYQMAAEVDFDQILPSENSLAVLKKESLQNIAAGKCDAIFDKILNDCLKDREKAKELAYTLFSGSRCDYFRSFNVSGKALSYLLLDEKLSTPDLCHVIKNAFEDLKKEKIPSSQTMTNSKEINGWNGYPGEVYQEDEMVAVHHGGGRRHIESFLKGSSESGYKCDSDHQGIFLTPIPKNFDRSNIKMAVLCSRAPLYATRTPLKHCDDAQVIAGLVQKKYLHSVNCNAYEVILKKEDASRLTLLYSETIAANINQLPVLNKDKFLCKFDEDPDLKIRLSQSFDRLFGSI